MADFKILETMSLWDGLDERLSLPAKLREKEKEDVQECLSKEEMEEERYTRIKQLKEEEKKLKTIAANKRRSFSNRCGKVQKARRMVQQKTTIAEYFNHEDTSECSGEELNDEDGVHLRTVKRFKKNYDLMKKFN